MSTSRVSQQSVDHDSQDPTSTTSSMAPWSFSIGPRPDSGPSKSPLQTILIFTAVLTPLALLPYALTRKRLLLLHKEVAQLRTANALLARDVRKGLLEQESRHKESSAQASSPLAITRASFGRLERAQAETRQAWEVQKTEVERLGARVHDLHAEVERLGARVHDLHAEVTLAKDAAHVATGQIKNMISINTANAKAREAAAVRWRMATTASIESLLEDRRRSGAHSVEGNELGRALADIAAFMQEVEIRQGWAPLPEDGRGIERLRAVARKLEETTTKVEEPSPSQRFPEFLDLHLVSPDTKSEQTNAEPDTDHAQKSSL